MKPSKPAVILLLFWAVLFVAAFVAPRLVAPTGDGFTRGLNRLGIFFIWHFGAFVLAVASAIYGWRSFRDKPGLKWLCAGPFLVHLGLVLLLVGVVLFTRFNKPDAHVYTAPTKPAATAMELPPVTESNPPVPSQTYMGIFRSGFEMSHFYTMDGQGPWWLEANESDWETLQSFYVEGPGRSGGVTVAMTIQGYLAESDPGLESLNGIKQKIHLTDLDSIRPISPQEFDLVLKTIRKEK